MTSAMVIKTKVIKAKTKWNAIVEEQPRLPWMLLVILCILLVSFSHYLQQTLQSQIDELKQPFSLNLRLNRLLDTPLDPSIIDTANTSKQRVLSSIPIAKTQSTAEAGALEQAQANFKPIKQSRIRVVGVEPLADASQAYWSVRVEVRGKLKQSSFPELLELFNNDVMHRRLTSLQYNMRASDSITVIVDYLYRENQEQ